MHDLIFYHVPSNPKISSFSWSDQLLLLSFSINVKCLGFFFLLPLFIGLFPIPTSSCSGSPGNLGPAVIRWKCRPHPERSAVHDRQTIMQTSDLTTLTNLMCTPVSCTENYRKQHCLHFCCLPLMCFFVNGPHNAEKTFCSFGGICMVTSVMHIFSFCQHESAFSWLYWFKNKQMKNFKPQQLRNIFLTL